MNSKTREQLARPKHKRTTNFANSSTRKNGFIFGGNGWPLGARNRDSKIVTPSSEVKNKWQRRTKIAAFSATAMIDFDLRKRCDH
jgi:hypothetical protein